MSSAGPLVTHVAHAGFDEHRFLGHDVLDGLVGHTSFTALALLSVAGRLPSPGERALLDGLAAVMALADPRIWPLKAARLTASYGRETAGIAAGLAVLEGAGIGPWTCGEAARLIAEARDARASGEDLAELAARHRRLTGFGVAFRERDERVERAVRLVDELGVRRAPAFRAFEALADAVYAARGLRPNVGAAVAAACLDLGLRPDEISALACFLQLPAFVANAREGARQAAPVLRQLPAAALRYEGAAPRLSPRARDLGA